MASSIVAELQQYDSLKTYAANQQAIIQKQDSINQLQTQTISSQKKSLSDYSKIVMGQNIEINTLNYNLTKKDNRIRELEAKKPRRGIWFVAGTVAVAALKILL